VQEREILVTNDSSRIAGGYACNPVTLVVATIITPSCDPQ
jgi:hypothetical protein